jgi:maleate cis-trans isomerase
MLAALKASNIERLSVATPYPDEINKTLKIFLKDNGFDIRKIEGLHIKDVWEHAKVSPEIIYSLARKVNDPEAQALFVSCTQLRAIDIIEELERDIGKPVITAVQASLWLSLRKIGVLDRLEGLGRLGEIQ